MTDLICSIKNKFNDLSDRMNYAGARTKPELGYLSESFFESDEYTDMSITRKNGHVIATLIFEEFVDCECIDHDPISCATPKIRALISMRYTYAADKKLARVEQKINDGDFSVQWDRHMAMNKAVSDFDELLRLLDSAKALKTGSKHE